MELSEGPTPAASADQRPLLIVVSSLAAASRRPFFESISTEYRAWLFLGGPGRTSEPTWELAYIAGYTVVNTQDSAAMRAAARALAEWSPIDGVICFDEARIEATAELASSLGLPTSGVDAVRRCRDKWRTRRALDAAAVPQAASVAVGTLAEARQAADRIGFPVVIKPRAMAASFGVTRVESAGALCESYRHARDVTLPEANVAFEDGVLVEEYLDGPEISVDCACFDGQVIPVTIARKECGFAPSFEETGHQVDAGDPLLRDDELTLTLTRAHQAVGFHTGTTHVELRLTPNGFKIVEINARLGGDLIPYLGQLATGCDLSLAAAAIACGRTPDLARPWHRVAAIRFYYPEQEMTVASVSFDGDFLPVEVERAVPLAEADQHMLLPPRGSAWQCRVAQVVAVADSSASCAAALDAATQALIIHPADQPETSRT